MDRVQIQPVSNIAVSVNLFFVGQLVFVPAPLEVKGKDIDASNSVRFVLGMRVANIVLQYALGAGGMYVCVIFCNYGLVSFEQRVALSSELGDAMKKIQQKRANN